MKISGTNWIPPILGQLFDDPYAAVRFVAERSARTIGESLPAGYDYTIPPDTRPPIREQIWERWLASRGVPGGNAKILLADAPTLAEQRAAYDALLAWRDHRRIRLRE